ncbi:hypothetical protein KY347_04705 [Candidatus Woesearchaeota archaeon]|nr:hypothetical protein [Candidatus Woesearchaeota archaeon]
MSKRFAFKLSLLDWIRKLNSNYEDPVDFLSNFVSLFYEHGATVDIHICDDAIELEGSGTIEDKLFENVKHGNFRELTTVIPPVKDYEELTLKSGNWVLKIDGERNMGVEKTHNPDNGTRLLIKRNNPPKGEIDRLCHLYRGSDLEVKVNGKPLTVYDNAFEFQKDAFCGRVVYKSTTEGRIHFFERGRYISNIPFLPGVDMALHDHNIPTTLTKSRVITSGKGKEQYDRFQQALPLIMTEFLKSDYVSSLREKSERSYQTLLRTVFNRFKDNREICDIVRENICFADTTGKINIEYSIENLGKNLGLEISEPELYKELTGKTFLVKEDTPEGVPYLTRRGVPYLTRRAFVVGSVLAASCITTGLSLNPVGGFYGGINWEHQEHIAREIVAPRDGSGYIRLDTSNYVFQQPDGTILWGDREPYDTLISSVHVELPEELTNLKEASTPEKMKAVWEHINKNFEYDAIEPEVRAKYPDILTAMISERKADCSSGNTYAALLLHELEVYNLRYAVGPRSGIDHGWLEIENDGQWEIADFTPEIMSETFQNLINEYGGIPTHAVNVSGNRFYSFPGRVDVTIQNPVFYTEPSLNVTIQNPVCYTEPILKEIGLALAFSAATPLFVAGTYMVVSKLISGLSKSGTDVPPVEANAVTLKTIEDILDIPVVATKNKFEYSKGTIYIPPDRLNMPVLGIVTEAVPQLPPDRQLEIYRKIANLAK